MAYPETVRAGLIQFDVRSGDIHANRTTVFEAIGRLADAGADLAVLPELWSCGFDHDQMAAHAEKTPEIIEDLRALSKKYGMLIAGSLPELSGGRIYNTLYVTDRDGSIAGTYRKIHLFKFNREEQTFSPGDRAVVCATTIGPIGLMICYDLRFPELCRSLAIAGARLVVVCAQWPKSRVHHWDALLTARAIENQIFIAAANRVGTDGDLTFTGHSRVISPDGATLAGLRDATGEAAAQIEFSKISEIRQCYDTIRERVPSAYPV
jgi:predicted amidohydrolase